jgi:DNA invertase Pin-like site-specific DNA recombinase
MPALIRAALYARVSTSNGQTTENQLAALREVAARQGWEVVAEHIDDGVSGAKSRDRRPAFDQMLRAVTRREVDLVAAWSVDRLGRSLQDLIATLEELRAAGCDLYLHQQALDTRTPAGRALFGMLAVFAEFERALIVERVKAGMARAKATGTRSGKPIGKPRVSAAKRAAIAKSLAEGMGFRAVARLYGVGHSVVTEVRNQGPEPEA